MKIIQFENNYELQANLFSFVIHLTLFIFMIFTIQWKSNIPYFAEVDLWDAVPTQVKIKKIALPIKKNIIQRKPPPEVNKKAEIDKEAEIKLKKKKKAEVKAKALKKKKQIAAVQKNILEQEKVEKLQEQLLEQEKVEKLQEQLLEQEKVEKLQEHLREQELKSQQKLAVEGDKNMLAGMDTGELERFKALIQQKIQQNVNKQLCGLDRLVLEFEINLMPTGEILGEPKMTQSSKMASCDEAVERAILQSQPLPIPKEKKLFNRLKNLKLKFRPNGLE